MEKPWRYVFTLLIGFALGMIFQVQFMAPQYREAVFERFFFKRSKCLAQEAYTNGKVTWVVEDNWKFVFVKGAPEPCGEDGRQ